MGSRTNKTQKRIDSIILVLLALSSLNTIAEPKLLVCENSQEGEEERFREMAEQYRNEEYVAYSLENAKLMEKIAVICANAKYKHQYNFYFDTKGFTTPHFSIVEVQRNYACGESREDVVKGRIEATPTTVSFKWETGNSYGPKRVEFNVDRKDLTGGVGTKRDFSCVLSDIDTSDNLL